MSEIENRLIIAAERREGVQFKRAEAAEALADDLENQNAELCMGLDDALGRVAELEGVLRKCLDRETIHARLSGFSDCACMGLSHVAEIEYETGQCPHQLARQILSSDGSRIMDVVKTARIAREAPDFGYDYAISELWKALDQLDSAEGGG